MNNNLKIKIKEIINRETLNKEDRIVLEEAITNLQKLDYFRFIERIISVISLLLTSLKLILNL